MRDLNSLQAESADSELLPTYRLNEDPTSRPCKRSISTLELLVAVVTTILGSALPAGHNLAVINTPQKEIRDWLRSTLLTKHRISLSASQDNILWGIVVSIFVAGALVGGIAGTVCTDYFGGKKSLFVVHLLNFVSGIMIVIGCHYLNSVELLLFGRLLAGLMAGTTTALVPLFLCGIAPSYLKGVMGTIYPLGITSGVLVSQVLGLPSFLGNRDTWGLLVGIHAVFALIALLLQPFLPSSGASNYLYDTQELSDASSSSPGSPAASGREAGSLLGSKEATDGGERSLREILTDYNLRRPLICVVVLNVGQQLSGINVVFYYSTLVFVEGGFELSDGQAATIGTGVANLLMASLALPFIRYCGRKVLLTVSVISYCASQLVLMISLYWTSSVTWASWVAFIGLFSSVITYGIGLGPIPYMIGTEIFPSSCMKVGLALGSASNWGANLVVGLFFPVVQNFLGLISFTIFIGVGFILLIFIQKFVPETLVREAQNS